MQPVAIDVARQRRDKVAGAALHLQKISKQIEVSPRRITREKLYALPAWCALELNEIRDLQRVCGALYFTPVIVASIDGQLLRKLRDFVGQACFNHIRSGVYVKQTVTVNIADRELPIAVMAAGSGVLLSTLEDQYLVDLFEHLLGPRSVVTDIETALSIVKESHHLLWETSAIINE